MDVLLAAAKEIKSARNEGVVAKGILEVVRSVETGKAKIVFIAEDVDLIDLVTKVKILCNQHNVPYLTAFTRDEMGLLLGLTVGTSFSSVVKQGLDRKRFYRFLSAVLKENFPDYYLVAKAKAKDEE